MNAPASAVVTRSRSVRASQTCGWWIATFAVLVVAGDISDGWIFWLVAHFSVWWSAALALVWAWVSGYWLTLRGLAPAPGRLARFLLRRLALEPDQEVTAARAARVQQRLTSVAWAVPLTLLLGGVVTTLVMRKNGVISANACRVWAFWLTGLFAIEFAAIHGLGIGGALASIT